MTASSPVDMRLLTLPLTARDGALTASVLARAGIDTTICSSVTEAIDGIREGAAALLIAEEAVTAHQRELRAVIGAQPPWSDLPVIVLTRPGAESLELAAFEWLGNVTLMDRPVRIAALVSVVRTALRARSRQYDMRDELAERVRTQEALQLADARKDEFLATLGHELRNPLAPLLTALRMLKGPDQADPAVAHIHAVMERQIGYLERLVDDLLEVSRITRGIVDVRREPVDLGFPLRAAVETSRSIIDRQHHSLILELPDSPITVLGDSVRLTQIFANLLNNAAKYTDPGGHIHVRASVEDGRAVVSVRDTGIGIDPAQLQSVFEMFTQVSRSNRRTQGGLGIGLTLVRSLVSLQGGEVDARSDGVGQGSTFIVRLPAVDTPASVLAPADRPLTTLPLQRILVVDDNVDAAEMLAALLGSLGATVTIATSGAQAIRMASDFRPDVVVLDIGMPGMDGYEVARRLRASPLHNETRLIALTGWGQDEDVRRAREAGIDHHLVKPPDLDTLTNLIAGAPPPRTTGQLGA